MKALILLVGLVLTCCSTTHETKCGNGKYTAEVMFYTNFGEKISMRYTGIEYVENDTLTKVLKLTGSHGRKLSVSYLGGDFTVKKN